MNKVTLYTKDECHLCQAARFVINKLRERMTFDFECVDITKPANREWYARYCNDIPVVHLNGREAFRHRVSEKHLRQLLEAHQPIPNGST